jgi:beta-lactamase superfamily II metal-dependent hydrolase
MYEVDFLPIEKTGELGSKSGDAIAMRFTEEATASQRVVVFDGGFSPTGEVLAEHITRCYGTDHVDLMISTHPDQDHINGLATVLDTLTVGELLLHIPHDHADDVSDFSNVEVVDALIGLAEEKRVKITEPFTGVTRYDGQIRVLGPTVTFYEELLAQHLAEAKSGGSAAHASVTGTRTGLVAKALDLLDRALAALPFETLGEDGVTGPRNDTSVVTLVTVDAERMLFTGDAGIPALRLAWDEYEAWIGSFPDAPLDFFQAPHHGSKRNLSPTLLNRMLGEPGTQHFVPTSFISSAKNDPKHPSPKVTNALKRRGCEVYATESKALLHSHGIGLRQGYGPATAIGPVVEDDD